MRGTTTWTCRRDVPTLCFLPIGRRRPVGNTDGRVIDVVLHLHVLGHREPRQLRIVLPAMQCFASGRLAGRRGRNVAKRLEGTCGQTDVASRDLTSLFAIGPEERGA